jgi:hypothetical protein
MDLVSSEGFNSGLTGHVSCVIWHLVPEHADEWHADTGKAATAAVQEQQGNLANDTRSQK